jgi:hypothetical protein
MSRKFVRSITALMLLALVASLFGARKSNPAA